MMEGEGGMKKAQGSVVTLILDMGGGGVYGWRSAFFGHVSE